MGDKDGKPQVVVTGVDGSEESVAALSWARRYAEATGATVRAVRAWHFPSAAGLPPVGLTPAPVREEVEQRLTEQLTESIAQAYAGEPAAGVQTRLVYGRAAQVLVDESADADLLVVGHRGHGAFPGMPLGSVSAHRVSSAHCPVVVVRGD
jgi:nucleotide-binding universal stress UspA family protein